MIAFVVHLRLGPSLRMNNDPSIQLKESRQCVMARRKAPESRGHKRQEIIVNKCATYKVDHQRIFATLEIGLEYEDSTLVVGRALTPVAHCAGCLV
jgi:hypothetical protein